MNPNEDDDSYYDEEEDGEDEESEEDIGKGYGYNDDLLLDDFTEEEA